MPHKIRIGKDLGDVSESTLRFFSQIGVEGVSIPTRLIEKRGAFPTRRPLVPPKQSGPMREVGDPWDESELRAVQDRVRAFGMEAEGAGLGLSGAIVMGKEGRKADTDVLRQRIEVAGKLRLRYLTYGFSALRASEGYGALLEAGRGGADYRDFDYERIKDLPPYESIGEIGLNQMWENLHWFLQAVIPTAEAAGVRLAVHPNDPPVPTYRGVAQPLSDLAGWKKLIDLVDSPSNCIFFDSGVTTEIGEDAAEVARYFGSRNRIGTVHFRNVRVETPRYKYAETFHDNGDCDMYACMRAFAEVGYDGIIKPDHTPYLQDDSEDTRIGWAFAIGQILALRNAVESGDP